MIFSLPTFLTIGAVLFILGLYIVMVRKNMIAILMGIELILNGCALNFAAFAFFNKNHIDGQVMVLFIIVLAALEAVVAFAIILSIFRYFKTVSIDRATSLKD